jgi:hypothetical protein
MQPPLLTAGLPRSTVGAMRGSRGAVTGIWRLFRKPIDGLVAYDDIDA